MDIQDWFINILKRGRFIVESPGQKRDWWGVSNRFSMRCVQITSNTSCSKIWPRKAAVQADSYFYIASYSCPFCELGWCYVSLFPNWLVHSRFETTFQKWDTVVPLLIHHTALSWKPKYHHTYVPSWNPKIQLAWEIYSCLCQNHAVKDFNSVQLGKPLDVFIAEHCSQNNHWTYQF